MKRNGTWLPPGPLSGEVISEIIRDASDEMIYLESRSDGNSDLQAEKRITGDLVRLARFLLRALEKTGKILPGDEAPDQFMAEILQGRVEILEKIVKLKEDRFTLEFPENPSRLPLRKRSRN